VRTALFIGLLTALIASGWSQTVETKVTTELGVAHIGGLYALSEADYLNEGAATALGIGAKCIKVSLSLDTEKPSPMVYRFHSQWPSAKTLEDLADTPYFRALFAKEFDTFILTSFRPERPAGYWREKFTHEDELAEEECFASLTRYLLRTYRGTHKTFILQNWEGDWALRGSFDPASRPSPTAIAAMIRWLSARQRGVARAREEFPPEGPRVFHACEVNLVKQAMQDGAPSVTTDVLPQIAVDLVSYSAWDTTEIPARFGEALAFIAKHKLPTEPFGERGVYVGEFGLPETGRTPEQVLTRVTKLLAIAQEFGCPYAVYWQLYCNEPIRNPPVANEDYKGFWLVRPDGTQSPVCRLFQH
jgi:hypothetical protein